MKPATTELESEIAKVYHTFIYWCKGRYGAAYDEEITSLSIEAALGYGSFDKQKATVLTLLRSIATNKYKLKARYESRKIRVHFVSMNDEEFAEPVYEPQFYEESEQNKKIKLIIDCIKELSPQQQKVVKYLYQNKRNSEIARLLNISADTTKSLIWTTKNALKNKLYGYGIYAT